MKYLKSFISTPSLKKIAVFSGATFAFFAAPSCNSPTLVSQTYPIPATEIQGNQTYATATQALGPQSITFDFSGSLSKFPGDVTITRMEIRTLLNDSSDATSSALTSNSNMNGCRPNQPTISFIQSIVIHIKKQSDPDSAYVQLASGNYDSSQPCSISLTTNTNLNFENYANGYTIEVVPTGDYPANNVYLGGLVSGSYKL